MKINFSKDNKLTISQTKKINEIEPVVREEYENFIGLLAKKNSLKGIDWLLDVTCRNSFSSNLHQRMCQLALIEEIVSSGDSIEEIVVDDFSMKEVIKDYLEQEGIKCRVQSKRFKIGVISLLYNILLSAYLLLNQWLWPKLIRRSIRPSGKVVLLENFLFLDSFDKKYTLIDRNYPGFFDYYAEEKKNEVWYLSILNGIKHPHQWLPLLNSINKSSQQILIMEDYLAIKDYLISFYYSLLLPMKIKKIPKWRNYDISHIVLEEAKKELGSYSLIWNILYYRSFSNLKDCKIEPKLVIDWHENQTIDRALNLGIKKNFPNANIKGYQGFVVSDFYSSLTPTLYEKENGLLPDQIYVISEKLIQKRKKYSNDFNILLAPAFRYVNAMHLTKRKKSKKDRILVALPMLYTEAQQVFDLVLGANFDREMEIIIKKHPTVMKKDLLRNVSIADDSRIKYTDKKLTDLLDESILFITMTSSAAIESVLSQTYVAIIANRRGVTANPIENIVDQKYWRLCYTPNCVIDAYNHAKDNPVLNESKYLVPLNRQTFDDFLNQ